MAAPVHVIAFSMQTVKTADSINVYANIIKINAQTAAHEWNLVISNVDCGNALPGVTNLKVESIEEFVQQCVQIFKDEHLAVFCHDRNSIVGWFKHAAEKLKVRTNVSQVEKLIVESPVRHARRSVILRRV